MLRFKKFSVTSIGLGLLSLALISGPAFTSATLDAAWLAIDFSQGYPPELHDLRDNPKEPEIACILSNNVGNVFLVTVGDRVAKLFANGRSINGSESIANVLRTKVFNLTRGEEHTCRAQVLASFVWK